jgi:hypothetical protein
MKLEVYRPLKYLEGAKELARRDKYQFQWWRVLWLKFHPIKGRRNGSS